MAPIDPNEASRVRNYTRDAQPPELRSFNLDMDGVTLTLTFSETVNVSSIMYTEITFQDSLDPVAEDYVLLGGNTSSANGPVIVINILREDEDSIKRIETLATEKNNTYISISFSLITDMDDLFIENTTLNVNDFTQDSTPPELASFNLNLTSDILSLTFTETVNASSLDIMQILLQGEEDLNENTTHYYHLTDSTFDETDDPVIHVMLSFRDRNEIKRLTDLATDSNNTFLSLSEDGIMDMIGLPVVTISMYSAKPVEKYSEDKVSPLLESFEFDLDREVLVLNFSETININTFDVTQITLHGTEGSKVKLTGGIVIDTDHTYQPTLKLSDPDLNGIKFYLDLGVSTESTQITFSENLVQDMNSNPVEPVHTPFAADAFGPDKTDPVLTAFQLDLHGRTLTLTFSETVAAPTLDPSQITLLPSPNASVNETFTFSSDSATLSANGTILIIEIGDNDFNDITRLDELAVSNSTTFLSITSDAVKDMSLRNVTAVPQSSPVPVRMYTPDRESPTLDGFSIDFTSEILTLTFSETVNVSSIEISAITIQADPADLSVWVELTEGTVLDGNDPIVRVQLDDYDLNRLKSTINLATSTENTFLSAESTLILDMAGNMFTAINSINALNTSEFERDSIPPELLDFDLDMNAGYLTLYFSESVNHSSLVPQEITFQNSRMDYSPFISSYTLMNDTAAPVSVYEHGVRIRFLLDEDDLSEIKELVTLATTENNTFLSITDEFISDQFDNPIAPINTSLALPVKNYTADINCPELESSEFDLNQGLLALTFTEPVNTTTFVDSKLFLYETTVLNEAYHQITSADYNDEKYTDSMTIRLSEYDLNTIKATTTLGTIETNTNIYLSSDAIKDTAGNQYCINTQPKPVFDLVPDDTPPEIRNFTIDLDNLELILTFSESVQNEKLNFSEITLLSSENSSVQFTLTNGKTRVNRTEPHIVILTLDTDDANEIKHIIGLASELENTYLVVTEDTVQDYSENFLEPIYEDDPLLAMVYRADNTTPRITGFDLDMDEGLLTITFTEVINITSLNVKALTLQSETNIIVGDNHTIQSGNASFRTLTEVAIKLSVKDLNTIKRIYNLASNNTNTYLSVESFFVTDNVGLNVDRISSANATYASEYIPDDSNPILEGFSLNLTSEILTLTFDETVDTGTVEIKGITIQSDDTENPDFEVSLTKAIVSDLNSTIVHIQLDDIDLHNIKRDLELATADNNTCLSIEDDTVFDMSGKPNGIEYTVLCTDRLTPDEVSPRLIEFGANVNASELYLRFDEPIDLDSIDVTLITLQSVRNITTSSYYENFTLTEGNVTSTDLLLFTVKMSNNDLNEIKKLLSLLRGSFTSNIVIPADFATDLNDNPIVPVPPSDALKAETFFDDSERPYLQEYDLDMDSGLLTLYFSETVNKNSFNITGLSFQLSSMTPDSDEEYNLQIQNVLTPENSPTIMLLIANDDLNILKERNIALTKETTFLKMTNITVIDIVNRTVIPLEGIMVKSPRFYDPDTNSPKLERFELDMNNGVLTLSFNETIVGSTLEVDQITLTASVGETSSENSFTLTIASSVDVVVKPEIKILIHNDDLNELKRRTNLTTSINTTYLFMTSSTVRDVSNNENAKIEPSNAVKAAAFEEDKERPVLNDYELDMNTGVLTLSFSETINSSSLNTQGITFYNGDSDYSQSYTLSGYYDYVIPEYDPVIQVKLTNDDLNQIKVRDKMATEANDTFLSLNPDTIKDMNGNQVSLKDITGVSAEKYTEDLTPPMLESFVIDMDSGQLHLNFTETILDTSILYDYLAVRANKTLASVPENINKQHQFEKNVTVLTSSGPQMTIELTEEDLNEIKRKDVCTIDLQEQDCFLVYRTGALTDMNKNPIQGCREL